MLEDWLTKCPRLQSAAKEVVAKQHKLMVCKVEVQIKGRQRQERFKRTCWWKLNEEEHREKFVKGSERRVGTGGMPLQGDERENEGRGKRGAEDDFRESGKERGDMVVEHRGAGSCG